MPPRGSVTELSVHKFTKTVKQRPEIRSERALPSGTHPDGDRLKGRRRDETPDDVGDQIRDGFSEPRQP